MLAAWKIGTDHLLDFLEKRLECKSAEIISDFLAAGDAPTSDLLKQVKPPTLRTVEEELEILEKKKKFEDDLSNNESLSLKMDKLREWGKNGLADVRKKLSDKHFAFMMATNMQEAQERGSPLERLCKVRNGSVSPLTKYQEIQKSREFVLQMSPVRNLKEIREHDNELVQYTKKLDNTTTQTKALLDAMQQALESSRSSRQILSIVQNIKDILIL